MVERDRLIAALEDATHASSIHNSQPWRFRLVEGGVAVHLDPTVTPRTVDPVGRWALASIGAVVANLELALTSRTGRAVVTEITLGDSIPEAADLAGGAAYGEGPLAIVTLGEAAETTTAMTAARLHGAIKERHTTRGPLLGGPPTEEEWAELQAAVAWTPGLQATPAGEDLVRALLALTARAENARQEDEEYLEEIQNWVENEAPSGTGIPRAAIGAPDAEGHVPIRDFTQTPMGSSGDGDAVFFEDPPALLVLHAASDTPADQLRAGYAMQRAMLEATALGLGVGVLGQALEEPDYRASVDAAVEESFGAPVVVHQILRLGHPAGTITYAATPRRPVAELMLD